METAEKRSAFIVAQAACAMAELEAMKIENCIRLSENLAPAYGPEAFRDLERHYMIGHNDVIEYLRDVS